MVQAETVRRRLSTLLDALADLRRYRAGVDAERLRSDRDTQHMVLHAMYVAAQSAIDLAFHALSDAEAPQPATYQQAFQRLGESGLLPAELARRMTGWAGLRNVLAHHYPIIDYGRVHAALVNDLADLEAFAAAASSWLGAKEP
ncbi:MAG TPA: DUF86 domain-containing protein [Myxococcota bacterium]|jgi:uncharacterized protein YutE (UPF0331/DUF86 family)|nr:DUF86 domain-containing protein [Myxococcota bacterium]